MAAQKVVLPAPAGPMTMVPYLEPIVAVYSESGGGWA